MHNAIFLWVLNNIGIVTITLLLALLIGYVGYLSHKWKARFQTLFKDVDNLIEDVDDLKKGFEKFTNQFDDHFLEKLAAKVVNILNTKYSLVTQNESPVSLTKLGKEIGDNVDAEGIASNYIERYKAEHPGWKNMNAYRIQQTCFEFCVEDKLGSLLSEQEQKTLEDDAYQRGIELSNTFRVIGIVMRDKVLKEMGIDVNEVDKHDQEQP